MDPGNIETPGVKISGREIDHYHLNFKPCILKMKSVFNIWFQCKLPLKGKITSVNILIVLLFLYLFNCIFCKEGILREIKQEIIKIYMDR